MFRKVNAIYFSPTGNSKKTAITMAEAIGEEVEIIDVTVMPSYAEFGEERYAEASRQAVIDMIEDINSALANK